MLEKENKIRTTAIIGLLIVVSLVVIIPAMGSYGQVMIKPVTGTVTQEFGGSHTGIDIYAPLGTPVYAPSNGVVTAIRTGSYRGDTGAGGAGNYIIIEHNPGDSNQYLGYCPIKDYTRYYHLDSVGVSVGQSVTQGQQIGTVGNTGNTQGPTGLHLHFEVRENSDSSGSAVNPRWYVRFGDGKDLW